MRMDVPGQDQTLDTILDGFVVGADIDGPVDRLPITFWVPVKYKQRYDVIQRLSRKRFSKIVSRIICWAVDRVPVEYDRQITATSDTPFQSQSPTIESQLKASR